MLPSYLLSLREGLEAALIIGIVLGALRKTRREEFTSTVWLGVISASLISIVAAVLLTAFGYSLEEKAEMIFEGITMLLAASVLTWMIFWMNRQSQNIKSELEEDIRRAASAETARRAVFFVAFLAVLREGVELALFLTAAAFASDSFQTTLGAILGLSTSALLGWTLFASTVRLDLRRFFQVTGVLLILFAAGLVAHGIHEFNEVGWIPAIVEHVWDVNAIVDESSTLGGLLKALFGYNGNPSLTEMIGYAAYFIMIGIGLRASKQKPRQAVEAQV
jgi:high-affinity iron transporter